MANPLADALAKKLAEKAKQSGRAEAPKVTTVGTSSLKKSSDSGL